MFANFWPALGPINGDELLHNVHIRGTKNREVNVGLPTSGMAIDKILATPEWAVSVVSDIRPWMGATIFVNEHPWFDVTGADGRLATDGQRLPDGDYAYRAWHAVLGERDGRVRVTGGRGRLELTYGP